jgi:hypothetical protein
MHTRTVAPEWLDSLPVNSPEAQRSRRDLRIIHRIMRTRHWLQRQLARLPETARASVAEVGAGDGQLLGELLSVFNDLRVCGYDRVERPANWPSLWDWRAGDFFEHATFHETTLVGLLIFHHFEDDALMELGKQIQAGNTRYLIAVEPARYRQHLWLLKAGRLLGFCKTTLHDGAVSIRGGFRDEELPLKLGLDPNQWQWQCQPTVTGAYRMCAWRSAKCRRPALPD